MKIRMYLFHRAPCLLDCGLDGKCDNIIGDARCLCPFGKAGVKCEDSEYPVCFLLYIGVVTECKSVIFCAAKARRQIIECLAIQRHVLGEKSFEEKPIWTQIGHTHSIDSFICLLWLNDNVGFSLRI